jgi:hypothetical protein
VLASRPSQTVFYQQIMPNVYGPSYREIPRLAQAWASRLSKKTSIAEFLNLGYALIV